MGYYIQTPHNLGKADYLVEAYGAKIVGRDSEVPSWSDTEAIICVVSNGLFEAAGYAYSPLELAEFAHPDSRGQRPRIWLMMDKAKAVELSGYKDRRR